jgi:hypothetical protein
MWLGRSGTDNKKVGKGRNLPQIEDNDVLGLFILG